MSRNQNGFMAKIDAFGCFLQQSKIVSFLMILMVFAAGVFLLWKMPNESDLPQLHEGEPVPEDIVARIEFKCKDMKDVGRINFERRQNHVQIHKIDASRSKTILDRYNSMMDEIRRRGAVEKEEDYEPLNTTDEATAGFVKGLESDLFSILLKLAEDDVRSQAAGKAIEIIVGRGIKKENSTKIIKI